MLNSLGRARGTGPTTAQRQAAQCVLGLDGVQVIAVECDGRWLRVTVLCPGGWWGAGPADCCLSVGKRMRCRTTSLWLVPVEA